MATNTLANPAALAHYLAAAQTQMSQPNGPNAPQNGHAAQGTHPIFMLAPEDAATFNPQQPPVQLAQSQLIRGKSQADRTFSGLKKAGGEMAWTGLWSLLAIKGTVFCCGLLGWPFVIPAVLSGGKALRKFKEGYNAD
jgi:hypothetical protein